MMKTFVTAIKLMDLLSTRRFMVIDTRFSLTDAYAGKAAYLRGHIPGAVFLDMEKDLSGPVIPGITGRHPLPARSSWLEQVRLLGLKPQMQVVVYDDMGGASAARLWWMLRWVGHENVAVLSGGWQSWLKNNGRVSTNQPLPLPPGYDYSSEKALTRVVSADEIDAEQQFVIDAREPERFEGKHEVIDPIGGHIPGAVCMPFGGNLDSGGEFKSKPELQDRFSFFSEKPVVCYCGSGVTACHNILSMVHAGFDEPALYPGSWSEWINGEFRAVATGPENKEE